MIDVPTYAFVGVSAILFAIGLFGVITNTSGIRLLISIELILNGANLNFVAFSAHHADPAGLVYTLFSIAIAAAEAAVGLAIFINLFRYKDTVNVTSVKTMRW